MPHPLAQAHQRLALQALVAAIFLPAGLLAQAQSTPVLQVAAQPGLQVKLVEFGDFIQPNAALVAGDINANIYQHQPFLDAQNKDRGYRLVPVAKAVNQRMGVYSKEVTDLKELKSGARVGIPNDSTNGSRALLVLACMQTYAGHRG